jgi:EmrB/QacA subfamily drug resistance transporter
VVLGNSEDCRWLHPHGTDAVKSATWVLVIAILGSAMTFIDSTAVNVSLPVIQRQLGASAGGTQWIVEGYALFLSSLILLGGALGDLYGRRRIFTIGIIIFALASCGCALAQNIAELIAARCVQGIGGALSTPGSLALISDAYSGDARGRAIGTWSGFSALTSAAGPIIGGWLTQQFSWRYVFLINVPIAVAVVTIAWVCVPESRDQSAERRIDVPGAVLATLGLALLVYGMTALDAARATPDAIVTVVAGLAVLAAFVVAEMRSKDPMVDCDLFRSRTFTAANIYTFFLYAALGGSLFFVPFILINVHHYSPLEAGAALLPFVAIMVSASRWSGGLVGRMGARTPLVLGAILAAVGFAAYAIPGSSGSYWMTYFPAAVILGCGGALFVAPLTTSVMNSVPVEHAGVASGINNAVARTAGLVGIAALGIIVNTAPKYLAGFREAMIAGAALSIVAVAVAAVGISAPASPSRPTPAHEARTSESYR